MNCVWDVIYTHRGGTGNIPPYPLHTTPFPLDLINYLSIIISSILTFYKISYHRHKPVMFRDHQLKWRSILMLGALAATVAWFLIFLLEGVNKKALSSALLRFGLVSFLLFCLWQFFTLKAWRWRFFNFKGWLVTMPYLKGRWVGTYQSSFDDYKTSHKMTLEITSQTLLNITCVTHTDNSRADGYSARMLSDRENQEFKLAFLYHSKREPSSSVVGDEHEGLVILQLIEGNPRRLVGTYINDRHPQPNKGEIRLVFESQELKGRV